MIGFLLSGMSGVDSDGSAVAVRQQSVYWYVVSLTVADDPF